MFDNQSTNQPLSASGQTAGSSSPQPPQVEDIFSQTEAAPTVSQVVGPAKPGQLKYNPPVSPLDESYNDLFGDKKFGFKKILTLLLIVVVIGGLGVGGWWLYNFVFVQSGSLLGGGEEQQDREYAVPENTPTDTQVGQVDDNQQDNQGNMVVPEADSDSDGLSDSRERELGTDPNQADSDNDGLTDKMELDIYSTDPLNPDTDSDGYGDGREVSNGYDPARPGEARLYDIPVE